jgi:hypothetical protein
MTTRAILPRWSALAALLCGLGTGCGAPSVDPSLPVYTTSQTASMHPGHRRTTISGAGEVYVNDFEEASLHLAVGEPTEVVGRTRSGSGTIRAIPGQSPSVFLAVDVGSEMPAYAVFRNAKEPPFDWRHATFRKMRLDAPGGPAANKETDDPAAIEDVLRTLATGAPAAPPVMVPPMPITEAGVRVHGILLICDQLPGLVFRPSYYLDAAGQVYLAESPAVTYNGAEQTVDAEWIPASRQFSRWVRTR